MAMNNKVAFRFLGKVYEAEVLKTYFNENWKRECHDLQISSGEFEGRTLTVPVDFTFANAEDARTKLHVGNKIKYQSGDGICIGEVIGVNDGGYLIRDVEMPSEVFGVSFNDIDIAWQENGCYMSKNIRQFRMKKGVVKCG